MKLELTQGNATLLARILSGYLSDLRMEVAGTDKKSFRDELKREEEIIKSLIAAIQESPDFVAAAS